MSIQLSRCTSSITTGLDGRPESLQGVYQEHGYSTASGSGGQLQQQRDDVKGKSRAVGTNDTGGSAPTNTLSTNLHSIPSRPTCADTHDLTELYSGMLDMKPPLPSLISMNRAQIIIDRLEGWLLILRQVSVWLEEAAKINLQSSRAYYHRALQHVDWSDHRHVPRGSALSIMVGSFRSLTAHVASRQSEAAEKMQHEYVRQLDVLRRECKAKLNDLKNNRSLRMDELVKRAEDTRKHMQQLDKFCQAANATHGQVAHDPWLENLLVLRSLKRELDEDNRLRIIMTAVQQQMAALESRIIEALQPTVQYCYNHCLGESTNALGNSDTSRYRRLMDRLDPRREWTKFVKGQRDLVADGSRPTRSHLHIVYKNMAHPAVMTRYKGTLYRELGGMRNKSFERHCVLTHCGFLHEFSVGGKVHPEASIYVPKATLTTSVDISYLAEGQVCNDIGDSYTIHIRRPTSALQRDKIYVFRAISREELLIWGRSLLEVAAQNRRQAPSWKRIQRRSTTAVAGSSNKASLTAGGVLLKRSATQPHARQRTPAAIGYRVSEPQVASASTAHGMGSSDSHQADFPENDGASMGGLSASELCTTDKYEYDETRPPSAENDVACFPPFAELPYTCISGANSDSRDNSNSNNDNRRPGTNNDLQTQARGVDKSDIIIQSTEATEKRTHDEDKFPAARTSSSSPPDSKPKATYTPQLRHTTTATTTTTTTA